MTTTTCWIGRSLTSALVAVVVTACATTKPEKTPPEPAFADQVGTFEGALDAAIAAHQSDIDHCAQQFPPRQGFIEVGFTILADGRLVNVRTLVESPRAPTLAPCIVEAMKTWNLPPLLEGFERVETEHQFEFLGGAAADSANERLTTRQIREVVANNRPRTRRCLEEEVARAPGVAGEIRLAFDISPDGTASATVESESVGRPLLVACVLEAARSWQWPKRHGHVMHVSYPYKFGALDPR